MTGKTFEISAPSGQSIGDLKVRISQQLKMEASKTLILKFKNRALKDDSTLDDHKDIVDESNIDLCYWWSLYILKFNEKIRKYIYFLVHV